jgi:2-polyprenyl-3-methyl-5-hydroxy-6-metoxy-1,4-benzoquinol methylase
MHKEKKFEEREWWNQYSELEARRWGFTPCINRIIRRGYLNEMRNFLKKDKGVLIDIGCGDGWVSSEFVNLDMKIICMDLSVSQIRLARKKLGRHVFFIVGTLACIKQKKIFDSVLIHGVLHHLAEDEIKNAMKFVKCRLKDNGKVYIYEPCRHEPFEFTGKTVTQKTVQVAKMLLKTHLQKILIFLLKFTEKTFFCLGLVDRKVINARTAGWTGVSPEERPLEMQKLISLFNTEFSLSRIEYWHAYVIQFVVMLMDLKPLFRTMFIPFVFPLHFVDRIMLKTYLKRHLYCWTYVSFFLDNRQ